MCEPLFFSVRSVCVCVRVHVVQMYVAMLDDEKQKYV